MVAAIAQVPPDIAVAIASWLAQPQELVRLALASKTMIESPLYTVCFRQQIRLHVPSDRQCLAWLVGDRHGPLLPQALPVNLSIALLDTFPKLHEQVATRVETLVVKLAYYHDFTRTLEVLSGLAMFPNLTVLVLCCRQRYWFSVDLRIIAEAAPQLRVLRTEYIGIAVVDVEATPKMLQLQYLAVKRAFIDTIAQVFRVCPCLESLDCDYWAAQETEAVADWPPLHSIRLGSGWRTVLKIIRAIDCNRLPVFEGLIVRGLGVLQWPQLNFEKQGVRGFPMRELHVSLLVLQDHWASLVSLRFLRCLRLANDCRLDQGGSLDDASPLASLPLLEELEFDLSRAATNCRALRALTHPRVITMMDGWLRDFLEYTPHLESIHCDEMLTNPPPRLERLREITIGSDMWFAVPVTLHEYAHALLERASVVELHKARRINLDLERVCASTKLVSLAVCDKMPKLDIDTSLWPRRLANVSSMTVLRYRSLVLVERCPWDLHSATSLRVLDIEHAGQDVINAIGRSATTLVILDELKLDQCQDVALYPLAELPQLRIVKIPRSVWCGSLREGIKQGELLQLRYIIHGSDDCLHTGH